MGRQSECEWEGAGASAAARATQKKKRDRKRIIAVAENGENVFDNASSRFPCIVLVVVFFAPCAVV